MNHYLLLEIEKVFNLSNDLLVVAPDFPASASAAGAEFNAILKTPCGQEWSCSLSFQLGHFNIAENDDSNQRWRSIPVLKGVSQHDVPIGSELIVADETIARAFRLRPTDAATATIV